jgi:hypothetical protein
MSVITSLAHSADYNSYGVGAKSFAFDPALGVDPHFAVVLYTGHGTYPTPIGGPAEMYYDGVLMEIGPATFYSSGGSDWVQAYYLLNEDLVGHGGAINVTFGSSYNGDNQALAYAGTVESGIARIVKTGFYSTASAQWPKFTVTPDDLAEVCRTLFLIKSNNTNPASTTPLDSKSVELDRNPVSAKGVVWYQEDAERAGARTLGQQGTSNFVPHGYVWMAMGQEAASSAKRSQALVLG